MDIREQFASSFGITADELAEVVEVGVARAKQRKLEVLLNAAQSKISEVSSERERELSPLRESLQAKQDEINRICEIHAQKRDSNLAVVTEIEGLLQKLSKGESVVIPSSEEILAKIE